MTQKPSDDWTLYYWGIAARAQYIRVVLDEAGVNYKEENDQNVFYKMVYCKGQNQNKGWPTFAPPFIKHGNVLIGQTNTVVRYVATKTGLLPKNEVDQFHCDQIMANVQDLGIELFNLTSMRKQDKLDFAKGRFQNWMGVFSQALGKNDFLFDNKCSYGDLEIWLILCKIRHRFGKDKYNEFVVKKWKNLEDLRLRVEKRPGVQKLLKRGYGLMGQQFDWYNFKCKTICQIFRCKTIDNKNIEIAICHTEKNSHTQTKVTNNTF